MKSIQNVTKSVIIFSVLAVFFTMFQGFSPAGSDSPGSDLSISKKVKVKVKVSIGRAGCSSGAGICGIVITTGSHWKNMAELNTNEYYAEMTYDNSGKCEVETGKDFMNTSTYNQYFTGSAYVMTDSYTIPKNSIGNNKAIVINSGSYPLVQNQNVDMFKLY